MPTLIALHVLTQFGAFWCSLLLEVYVHTLTDRKRHSRFHPILEMYMYRAVCSA